jgi:hypothetical protein
MAKRTLSDLPAKVKVGYIDYKVEKWSHDQADASERYGETDRVRRIIRIDTDYAPQQSAETLLHEILHCVWGLWSISDLRKLDEEAVVHAVGKGLATVIRDNPEVFAWIDMALRAEPVK